MYIERLASVKNESSLSQTCPFPSCFCCLSFRPSKISQSISQRQTGMAQRRWMKAVLWLSPWVDFSTHDRDTQHPTRHETGDSCALVEKCPAPSINAHSFPVLFSKSSCGLWGGLEPCETLLFFRVKGWIATDLKKKKCLFYSFIYLAAGHLVVACGI